MSLPEVKVGDRIRVIGEFTVERVEQTPWGPQYTHTDVENQSWDFIPGPSTTSIEILEES